MKTVKQISDLAGVSPRTLRWYDKINLLKPSHINDKGYRLYGEKEVLLLQQIMFYRELGLSLGEIAQIVHDPAFNPLEALVSHRESIRRRIQKLKRLEQTVDDTLAHLKEGSIMNEKKLFGAFSDTEEAKLIKEAETRYDTKTVRDSSQKWKKYTPEQKKEILDEGNRIYESLSKVMTQKPDSPDVHSLVQKWRDHMSNFWTPTVEQLIPLAKTYGEDPKFRTKFESFAPGLADFIGLAVEAYVARIQKKNMEL